MRRALLWLSVLFVVVGEPAHAAVRGAILHERIPPDPVEDLSMHVVLDGDLPAAIQTPSGIIAAPDPRGSTSARDSAYASTDANETFRPDLNTNAPTIASYDEPFNPSTAPYKRLEAFDAVRPDDQLYVRDTRLTPVPLGEAPRLGEDVFFADLVVDAGPGLRVRIPTVGPGTRMIRAHLGLGPDALSFRVLHDGAENWFVEATNALVPVRTRLVMELAIPRSAFGGELANTAWNDLLLVSPLPDRVAQEAAEVTATIGVSRAMRPRDVIARLVQYFRGFTESSTPPHGHGSVYLDLALSKKGVCRHRAFAFLITAQSLGIPTRFIENEAHAWVEVHDGASWKRIDLGGAGHIDPAASPSTSDKLAYPLPRDVFPWPQQAGRGDDLMTGARARGPSLTSPSAGGLPKPNTASSTSWSSPPPTESAGDDHDERSPSVITMTTVGQDVHRGQMLALRGNVRANGEPCGSVPVEVWLRSVALQQTSMIGTLATVEDGTYAGSIVVPSWAPVGDYDVYVRTPGDARCGSGQSR